jgi:hypothetical protein
MSGAPFQDTTTAGLSTKSKRQEAQRLMGVTRTGEMVNMKVNIVDNPLSSALGNAFYGPGTIVRTSDYSVTIKPDRDAISVKGKPGNKMVCDWFYFMKVAEPMD